MVGQRRVAVAAAVMVMVGVLAACQPSDVYTLASAKVGAKCTKVNAFAKNSTNVLVCSAKKRWVVKMPIAQAVNMINAYNQAKDAEKRANTATSVSFESNLATSVNSASFQVRVRVTNADGGGINGAIVQLTSSDAYLASQGRILSTDGAGYITTSLQGGTTAGTKNLTASVVGTSLSTTRTVTITPGSLSSIVTLSAASPSITGVQRVTFSGRAVDSYDNPVAATNLWVGYDTYYLEAPTGLNSSNIESDGKISVGADGTFSFTVTSTGYSGSISVDLWNSSDVKVGSLPLTILVGPLAKGGFIPSTGTSIPVGTSVTAGAVAADYYGNGVSGVAVHFAIVPGTATASVGVADAVTDADGIAWSSVKCGPTVGDFSLQVTISGLGTATHQLKCA